MRGYYDTLLKTCAKYPSRIAVRQYDNGVYNCYTYSELYGVCEYISQKLQQLESNRGIIGLVSGRNVIIPCVIAAAHKCCTTFMFLDPTQDVETVTKDLDFAVIVTIKEQDDTSVSELFGKKPDITASVFNLTINFYACEQHSHPNSRHVPQHSFIAMTSGSTGEPKHIQVPTQCIQPNINDLTKLFKITSEDIIYFSTPLTFDPSMIEILLACENGASLLIAPEKANILFPENKKNSITFWQTTPSKFYQYSNADIKNRILSRHSSLKILALGGEPLCSVKRLKELKDWDNKTKIFVLYGVTEMSCWACAVELDLNRTQSDKEIPLGNCLSETQLIVDPVKENTNTGKIILVSKTRQCIILNRSNGTDETSSLKFVDTGDLGEIKNGTVYYRGRQDDIIKRFGHKVNLQMVESTAMLCPRVKTCSAIWLPKPMLLVMYFASETITSQELYDFLKCKLEDKYWPDKMVRVDNLPTNRHGKISRQMLCKMYEKDSGVPHTLDSLKTNFLQELKAVISKTFTYDQIKNKDFFSIGGTSFLAISMCNKISLASPQFGKLILPYLMTPKKTIDEIMQLAHKEICIEDIKFKRRGKRSRSEAESHKDSICNKKSSMEGSYTPEEFIILWTYDTGKCVDASPTLFQTRVHLYVTVGSHSGKIVVANAITGELHGTISLKSRVEAPVYCYHEEPMIAPRGVVGSYDGTIVCFTLDNCEEIWKINIKSMIKSKATCCNGLLYVASYDGKVRCIDIKTGSIKETIKVADQPISADLVLAKNEYVLLGTLSGMCASIHTGTNTMSWCGMLGSPVFASPVLYDDDKYVVFAEVNGDIHCRTVQKGIKIWKFQGAKGNIFSSLYIKKLDQLKWQMVFGCHDCHVYSINIKNFQPSLHWKVRLTSPVYSTPNGLLDKYILAASNNGILCIINSDNGTIVAEYQLPNETYSSPAVYSEYIFVGCRNDNLYSLKYLSNS